jgi:hypothetical protein
MNIKFIDNILFGKYAKKTSEKERKIWYFSLLVLLLIFLFFLKDLLIILLKNNFWIYSIALAIYVIYGIKKNNWFKGIQGILLSIVLIVFFLGTKFQNSSYFLKLKKHSEYYHTQRGSNLWFNLKVKDDDTYEIQVAQPVEGFWSVIKKGKVSKLTKQRYTDSGEEYYCFYLEDYPYLNERTMIAFDNAFSSTSILKFNSADFLLIEGSNENPWQNN